MANGGDLQAEGRPGANPDADTPRGRGRRVDAEVPTADRRTTPEGRGRRAVDPPHLRPRRTTPARAGRPPGMSTSGEFSRRRHRNEAAPFAWKNDPRAGGDDGQSICRIYAHEERPPRGRDDPQECRRRVNSAAADTGTRLLHSHGRTTPARAGTTTGAGLPGPAPANDPRAGGDDLHRHGLRR